MATTIPTEFTGEAILTAEKLDAIVEWYHRALGDADKASDIENAYWYGGSAAMAESILELLYNNDPTDSEEE